MDVQRRNQLIRWLKALWRRFPLAKLLPLPSAIPLVGLVVAVLALVSFAILAQGILGQTTQAFDEAVLLALYRLHQPWLDRLMIEITLLGDPGLLGVISLCFGVAFFCLRRWFMLIVLAVAVSGALSLNILLKALFARARPELWERVVDVSLSSFPSGHAMIAVVLYGLLGYWLAVQYRVRKRLIIGATTVLVLAIGFSRMYLGAHWLTDIIAGYAAGLVWLVACIISLELGRARLSNAQDQQSSAS